MSRPIFPGRPRRTRGVFISSGKNVHNRNFLDFLHVYRRGLQEFEQIVASTDVKPLEGFSQRDVKECANRYLSYVQVDEEAEFLQNINSAVQGPMSSTPKLNKNGKPPSRNLAIHWDELEPISEESIDPQKPEETAVPVKRGRGRPPKLKSFQNNKPLTASQGDGEPKKRGRKRKISVALFEDVKPQQPDDKTETIWKSVVSVVDEFLQQQMKNFQFGGSNAERSLETLLNHTKVVAARCANYA